MAALLSAHMHLLLGVGDPDGGRETLEATVERARSAGDTLTVAAYSDGTVPVDDVVGSVQDRLADLDFEATLRTIDGDPGGRLVDISETEDVDCIVLPGGERSTLGKIRLGSVAEFVLLNATVTVTLVR